MEPRILTIALAALLVLKADSPLTIWAVGDGEKIDRDELNSPYKRGNRVWDGTKIKLFGARNEIIAFQVIVEAGPSGIAQLSATLPQLISENGQKIVYRPPGRDSSESVGRPIQLFAVNYLNVMKATGASWYFKSASARPQHPTGWKPVQLVPENARPGRGGFPLPVGPNHNQALWLEVYLGRDLRPGMYRGQVTVTADGKRTAIPVE